MSTTTTHSATSSIQPVPGPNRYSGEQVEPALGLTYLHARFLNPATFIDPSGNEKIRATTESFTIALGEQIAAFHSELQTFADAEGIALNLSEAVGIDAAEDAVLTLTGLTEAEERLLIILVGAFVSVGSIAVGVAMRGNDEEEERDILFGQKRAAPNLSFKNTVPSEIQGRDLKDVAAGMSSDSIKPLTLLVWDNNGTLISLNTRGRAVYALAGMRPRKKKNFVGTPTVDQRNRLTEGQTAYGDSLPARRITITESEEYYLTTCLYGVSINLGQIACPSR